MIRLYCINKQLQKQDVKLKIFVDKMQISADWEYLQSAN